AGASTRDIAAKAGVNAPALQYYFENKEGVYRACVESIAELGWAVFGPAVAQARAALDADADADTLIDAFVDILTVLAQRMFTVPKTLNQRMFFAREQSGQEPASASEILLKRMRKPLHDVTTELIARISGRPVDDPVTRLRALSLFGQLTVFHVAQRSALQLLGWESFDGPRAALLGETVADQTRLLLQQWHAQRGAKERRTRTPAKRTGKHDAAARAAADAPRASTRARRAKKPDAT
ncbi:CerR family C-terminal domain-containing protein, partial [Burkholderia multivorans]|nr:CerR family C-terminal domain-containing protein [Burkholderia multivorans]